MEGANWTGIAKEANGTANVKGANRAENTKEANGTGTQNKQMGKKTRINKVKETRKKDVIKIL